jgi:hypothetical protein
MQAMLCNACIKRPRILCSASYVLHSTSTTRMSFASPAFLPLHGLPNSSDISTPPSFSPSRICVDIDATDPPDARCHNLHDDVELLLRSGCIDEHKLPRHESSEPAPFGKRVSLAPPVLEHHICVRRVQREMQRAVRRVGMANFSTARACDRD